jgi:hypothetical protein
MGVDGRAVAIIETELFLSHASLVRHLALFPT